MTLQSKQIIEEAFLSASKATEKFLSENSTVYPCGTVNVKIIPARGSLVKYLKGNRIGRTGDYGGYVVYNPSGNHTQSMEAKLAGANAFVKVLTHYGFKAVVQFKID